MCYDNDARPPDLPAAGGAAHGQDLVLTSADGTQFAAYTARPEQPGGAQIVILPDVRGLHGFYKALALRFAEAGVEAIALDYFGRTAGLTARDDSFEFMPHVQKLTVPTVFQDVQAAIAHLHSSAPESQSIFTVGFCLGGSLSLLTGTQEFGQRGTIAFYAGLSRQMAGSDKTVLELSTNEKHPVLGLFGGADQGIPVEQVHTLDQNLDTAGVEHEVVIYEGAPHSFFDRKAVDFAEASTNAWERILNFISSYK
ncbi:dienelactone hydrolase family protein [Tengunoibacter tsumagoiensis]|uniref:Carboxymethylenebutenolidase n=1 Tax=Tengunoibacter tsumagoiensis TaxID=2014871 RepID=A0A401ZVD5_9CHLR|nr:dienelactone hydrolase family protein [Tengunoibacter tsumagoiensis]GCE10861.1 carboxymethylenebutenolidase [Tengunoibacter tsumagoiensis]